MHGTPTERILRAGLAFAFLYPAVSAWFNPFAWIGYFPPFLLTAANGYEPILLHAFGGTEILIALWVLFGRNVFWPSILAAGYLLGIVAFNLNQMDVIFRDISILAIAIVLARMHRNGTMTTEVSSLESQE